MADVITRRYLRQSLGLALVVAIIAGVVSPLIEPNNTLLSALASSVMGFSCTLVVLAIDFFIRRRIADRWPLFLGLLAATVLSMVSIATIILATVTAFGLTDGDATLLEMISRQDFQYGLAALAIITLGAQVVLVIRSILGRGVLSRILLGQYRRPKELKLFVMFIDLRDSTRLGEQLGPVRFLSFLNDFYRELDWVAEYTRGDIHKYAGDGAILTWNRHQDKGRNARPVTFFFLLQERVRARTGYFMDAYGEMPAFKAGLHHGEVLSAELGHGKKEIALIGDLMNTCARLEQACKTAGVDFLVSEDALACMTLEPGYGTGKTFRSCLRGKEQELAYSSMIKV